MKRIVTSLLCFILGAICLTGCTNNDEAFTEKNYTSDRERITEVYIDVQDRKLEVTLSTDDQIHISYFEHSKEYYDISVSENHVLTMTAVSNKEWTDYIGGKSEVSSRTIFLQIPDKLLSTLKLSTTNETISLSALTVKGDIELSTNSANLEIDNLNAGNSITLRTKNGDIKGSIIGSYDDYSISCDIKKGKSNLPLDKVSGAKTLDVSNNNGNINIDFIID